MIRVSPVASDDIFEYWKVELPDEWSGSRYTFILTTEIHRCATRRSSISIPLEPR